MMTDNLWNLGEHKTRRVIEYIKALRPPEDAKELTKFLKLRRDALTSATANLMLAKIGYSTPEKPPLIYAWSKQPSKEGD